MDGPGDAFPPSASAGPRVDLRFWAGYVLLSWAGLDERLRLSF